MMTLRATMRFVDYSKLGGGKGLYRPYVLASDGSVSMFLSDTGIPEDEAKRIVDIYNGSSEH